MKSHIIPQSIHKISTRAPNPEKAKILSSDQKKFPKRSPSGVYDRFLCGDCEKLFGPWDDYGLAFFKNVYALDFSKSNHHIIFGGYDYSKLKLFFNSVLWRASVSDGTDMYSLVSMDSKMEKDLGMRLLNSEEGEWFSFAVSLERFKTNRAAASIIRSPAKARDADAEFYIFYMSGFRVYLSCNDAEIRRDQISYYINPSRESIIMLEDFEGSQEEEEYKRLLLQDNNKGAF